jgi:uncharacterized protein (DUF2384 family)
MTIERLAQRLGGQKVLRRAVRSELDLAEAIDQGLSIQALEHVLATADLDANEAYELVGSRRTLMRKKKSRTKLSANESDRLARVEQRCGNAHGGTSARSHRARYLQLSFAQRDRLAHHA